MTCWVLTFFFFLKLMFSMGSMTTPSFTVISGGLPTLKSGYVTQLY